MSVILSIYICLPNVLIDLVYRFDFLSVCHSVVLYLSIYLSVRVSNPSDRLSCSLVICLSMNLSVYNCFFFSIL